jgi:hypothetical protein
VEVSSEAGSPCPFPSPPAPLFLVLPRQTVPFKVPDCPQMAKPSYTFGSLSQAAWESRTLIIHCDTPTLQRVPWEKQADALLLPQGEKV